jgi:hypothetical protein
MFVYSIIPSFLRTEIVTRKILSSHPQIYDFTVVVLIEYLSMLETISYVKNLHIGIKTDGEVVLEIDLEDLVYLIYLPKVNRERTKAIIRNACGLDYVCKCLLPADLKELLTCCDVFNSSIFRKSFVFLNPLY